MNRRHFLQFGVLTLSLLAIPVNQPSVFAETISSSALIPVTFGTNWYAQAEHGGFYQALATGIYQDYGLDVTIKMGGPQVNGAQLLVGGAVDFFMGSAAEALKAVEAGIPTITVAALFQKNPQVLMAHPNVGNDRLEALGGKPIFVSASANTTYWTLLKNRYGWTDDQKRPYNFSVAPFLLDPNSVQQGYLSSEPLTVERQGGFKPVIFLLADYGYNPYNTTIETTQSLVQNNPELVQKFVDASIQGWYSYLKNPVPGNELIKQANPQMTDELLNFGVAKLNEYGIIVSEDALTQGIGTMTDARWQEFYQVMRETGMIKKDINYKDAFTLKFVNH